MSFPQAYSPTMGRLLESSTRRYVIGDKPRRGTDIGRIKPDCIEGSCRDLAEVGVGPAGGRIAIMVLIDRASSVEFEIAAGFRKSIHMVDRFAQIAWIHVQSLRKLLDGVSGDKISIGDSSLRPPTARTHHAETVFPDRDSIRDQKRGDCRLPVRKHLQCKLMIRDRFVDKSASVAVDNHCSRFAAIEHEVRKDRV